MYDVKISNCNCLNSLSRSVEGSITVKKKSISGQRDLSFISFSFGFTLRHGRNIRIRGFVFCGRNMCFCLKSFLVCSRQGEYENRREGGILWQNSESIHCLKYFHSKSTVNIRIGGGWYSVAGGGFECSILISRSKDQTECCCPPTAISINISKTIFCECQNLETKSCSHIMLPTLEEDSATNPTLMPRLTPFQRNNFCI